MFKILHISDIHCQYSYLEYILEYAESENFNLIVVSGDLECDFVAEALANAKT
ncbi:MAG: metallophosphoesterase family protein, partial [Thermoprotei archaeon]|nr:metallophosphoesterase family protein [Thermoprotei archaeon]